MMTKFKVQSSKFKVSRGFTLIELMVVLSIIAVLGTLGIAGFTAYNKVQILQTSANDLAATLNLARSRALSQVKIGTNCSNQNNSLDSYEVQTTSVTNSYSLVIHCSNGLSSFFDVIYSKSLPANISFDVSTSPISYLFPVLKGGVTASGQIVIKDNNNNHKNIIVNSLGGVSIQ